MPAPILMSLLIVALPLAAWTSQFLHALFKRRLPASADKISLVAVGGSLALSVWLLVTEVLMGGGISPAYVWSANWFKIGAGASAFVLDFDVMVDNLTVIMFFVVTLVAFLVHLYSTSYMHGEDRYPRFFHFLSLFTFSMLGLIVTSNLAMLFVFWELVGVCSYFLIGFFITKKSAGDASKKAFVTNRIGDACFMAGIFLVIATIQKAWPGEGVLSFPRIWESIGMLGQGQGPWVGHETALIAAGILIFMGCVTKSAQFPLHVWLPDAMEGPTPVSALIHAATMVAAGVYMIVRTFPLLAGSGYLGGDYFSSPALWVVAGIGGITALFSGTIALVQQDLKKGLAYSTCSQLGYMVMAVGVGSITAAMFHLFTHAFFKACMFLGSGSVIHAVHSQDMKDMGGLRKKMPITFATFFISCLAIAGTPFFSGFLSKEAILGQAAAFGVFHKHPIAWLPFALTGITALLTSFYMFRLLFLTFYGPPGDHHRHEHAHESPKAMVIPLVVLASLAIISGGIASPVAPGAVGGHWFQSRVNDQVLVKDFMTGPAGSDRGKAIFAEQAVHLAHEHDVPASAPAVVHDFAHAHHAVHLPVMAFSLAVLVLGVGAAWFFFVKNRGRDFVAGIKPLAAYREVLRRLYFVDEAYCKRVVPTVKDVAIGMKEFDKKVVDGTVNGAAASCRNFAWFTGQVDARVVDGSVRGTGGFMMILGDFFRRMVSGKIQDYVQYTVLGLGVLLIWVVLAGQG